LHLSKILIGVVVLWASGCTPLNLQLFEMPSFGLRSQSAEKKHDKHEDEDEDGEFSTRTNTPLIGEYTQVSGLNVILLEGVGLVTGLEGTGGDPPPSMYRTALLDDMRRRGVKNPNEVLRSPNTALVVVRAYLPPLVRKGERFDVEVRVPDGSDVKSLNGGWLMETRLSEQALVPGRGVLKGHEYALAEGPVLVSMGEGNQRELAGVLRRGHVVGGGVSKKDRDLTLYLRNDFRSGRNAVRIASRIGSRFYEYDEYGQRRALADPKNDTEIELKVLSKYKDNFPRYLQVIRSIAFRETEVAQRVRMRDLKSKLLDPETSEDASLKLEAIGEAAVPVLKSGLKDPTLEVQFHSAVALAYLNEADGLPYLAKAARDEPAFRVFALAAMAAIDDAESHMLLRQLMNEPSAETRYGAFRALTTLDKNDPFVRGELLNDQFQLHALTTEGPPLVHLTNRRKSEIVLFGADQRFKTPLAVRAGLHILVTAPAGSETVSVSRFEVGRPDRRQTVSTRIADVIRAVTEMDASYPDVAQMLAQAGAQQNLPGRIAIDALPQAGRVYMRPESPSAGAPKKQARVGNTNLEPNLFSSFSEAPNGKESKEEAPEESADKPANQSEQESPGQDAAVKDGGAPSGAGNGTAGNESPGSGNSAADGKSAPQPAKSKSPAAKDHSDDEGTEEPASGRRWDFLRVFRGRGQYEPEIDATAATAGTSKSGAASEGATTSPPSQSEP